MCAYRVRRDRLKCAVLCYTLGRWEFERSTRHCMEFKVTKDEIARWNKMLLSLNENILTLPGFCCPFGLFNHAAFGRRGSCSVRGLFFQPRSRRLERFLLRMGFIYLVSFSRLPDAGLRSAKSWLGPWITRSCNNVVCVDEVMCLDRFFFRGKQKFSIANHAKPTLCKKCNQKRRLRSEKIMMFIPWKLVKLQCSENHTNALLFI